MHVVKREINLDFTSPLSAATSLRLIADEIEAERAKVIRVGTDPKNPSVLIFHLLGAKNDS